MEDKTLNFDTLITWEDYWKFNIHIFYNRAIGVITIIIAILMWLGVLAYFIFPQPDEMPFPFGQLFFAVFVTFGLPALTYWSARKAYKSHQRISERMFYQIDKEKIEIKGDSFESKMTWEKIHKVKETNRWFLIFQHKQAANIIVKSDLTDQEIIGVREIIRNVPNLKYKLK